MDKQLDRLRESFDADPSLNRTSLLFRGSRPDGIAVLVGTSSDYDHKQMILQNRKLERMEINCRIPSIKDTKIDNRKFTIVDKKSVNSYFCSLGIVPFCISGSYTPLTDPTFRTNFCMYYDCELLIAAISEGFGAYANDLSYIACRQAVQILLNKPLNPDTLDDTIFECFMEVEKNIEQLERKKSNDIDTLLTGTSLSVLVLYKNRVASGILGDAVLVKMAQNQEGSITERREVIEGLSMECDKDREKIFWSLGEIRKNIYGKECIYVKGREYPECPMMSCIGCRVGKKIGITSDCMVDSFDRGKIIDKPCSIMLANREFMKLLDDQENLKLLTSLVVNDPNSTREYIYGKLRLQCLQKGNPIDDCVALILIMDKETGMMMSSARVNN